MKPSSSKHSIFCFFLLLSLTLFLSGCSDSEQKNTTSTGNFDNFLTSCFKEYVSEDTITTHFKLSNPSAWGLSDSETPHYEDFSFEKQKEHCQRAASLLSKLNAYDPDKLSEDDCLTWKIFKIALEQTAASENYLLYQSLLGINGLQSQIPVTLSEYYFTNEEDIKTYLSLVNQVPELFEQLISFEEQRRQAGFISPDFVISDTIDQINQFLSGSEEENLLVETFQTKIESVPNLGDDQKKTYVNNNRALVRQVVFPAFEQLKSNLKQYLGTGTDKERLCQYKSGKEYYKFLLSANVGTSLTPEQCIQVLEQQLKNAVSDISSLTKKHPELYTDYLTAQPSLTDAEEILTELEENTLIDFPEPPEVNYTLKEVPDSLSSTSASAFYMIPPIDSSEANVIYINPVRVDSREQFSTLAHEGYPGHLYQNNYYLSTNPEPIRSFLRCNGYDEGWGTYAQLYSYHYMEFMDTDKETTARLRQLYRVNDILSISLSSLSDLYVNYENYTQEQLEDYLDSYGVPAENVQTIYRYVIENPTSYLSYSIGWYELEQLRQSMKEKLGKNFDLAEFHEAVLDTGSCPFILLNEQVSDFLTD